MFKDISEFLEPCRSQTLHTCPVAVSEICLILKAVDTWRDPSDIVPHRPCYACIDTTGSFQYNWFLFYALRPAIFTILSLLIVLYDHPSMCGALDCRVFGRS